MKKIIILLLCICNAFISFAQEDSISLINLEMPNAPAFIVLDQAHTSIVRPNSLKAFTFSAVNSFESSDGFPKNYAAEFAPYWYFKHPNLSFLKYAGCKRTKNGMKQNIFSGLRSTSISVAMLNTPDSLNKQSIDHFSVGMRSTILTVKSKSTITKILNANDEVVRYLRLISGKIPEPPIPPGDSDEQSQKKYQTELEEYNSAMKLLQNKGLESLGIEYPLKKKELRDLLNERPVFAVEAAAAYSAFFTDKDFSSYHTGRLGAWLTLNYSQPLSKKSSDNYVNLYAIARYLRDDTQLVNKEYIRREFIDVGGKLEFEFKRIALSYEFIYRMDDHDNTYRSNGLLKYKISNNIYLTGAFGKNFGEKNDLISLLGINWGFSTGQEKLKINNTNS